ncbi:DUF6968 family protein [Bradymonas sediminis]|uniref:DUF6968 domain-containing protein n=1 Tax=Bradymonas sediminis TaxID=1548548 RepID=A0A2Z4FJU0_9DELT|nr:hypothetical protein [Bradymonas sediminis]AWV89257.1 hypothetical protein DN745_07850 [Bradymonas sediminis]TDP73428.1 hypothetical protein DFR33_10668 [Bradymonas sediminis]
MMESLAYRTLYAYDLATEEITEITISLGFPEKVRDALWRASYRIVLTDGVSCEGRHGVGIDAWQALMTAISLLKLEVELLFQKRVVSFHFSRSGAEQQTEEVVFDEIFPKDRFKKGP